MNPREFGAAQDFLVAAKRYWSTDLYRNLRAKLDDAAGRRASGGDPASPPMTLHAVADVLEPTVSYQYFAWLERHLQKLKYSGPYGLVPYYQERRDAVLRRLDAPPRNATLTLDPSLELPDYYHQVDVHQHPGGLWSDELAGFIYETGARSTTPLLGSSHATLHDRFTALVASRGEARRILDLGCGFGKSTRPFARVFPAATIEAVDLSSACLRLAAAEGTEPPAAPVHYRQMNASQLAHAPGSFDLVTSTMLLHDRFTALVASRGEARRILDLGCGFGKSTRPFARVFPAATIEAIDLSAACLRLAAAEGTEPPAAPVHYRQMNAAQLAHAPGSFDLVTSTMLLHEIPPQPLRQVLEESFRVLEPGGRAVHLDFYYMPDAFRRFLHYGHGRRNNEPYMQPLAELDLPALLQTIGFVDVVIEPFRESENADEDAWRFPWTVISARKPPA